MPDRPDIPEEAAELAAEALWNERERRDPTGDAPDDWYPPGDNPDQPPPREPFLWEQMVAEGKFEGDQEETRSDALAVLQAAAPALRKQGAEEAERRLDKARRERLLGGEWPGVTLMRDAGTKSSPPWTWWEIGDFDADKYEVEEYVPRRDLDQALAKGAEEHGLSDADRERLRRIAKSLEGIDRGFQAQIDADRNSAAFLRDLADNAPPLEVVDAEQARQEGAEEERERLRGEERRLAAFEKLTEGNFFSFTDPEHQEEYVWRIVDAVLDAALDTPAPSEEESDA